MVDRAYAVGVKVSSNNHSAVALVDLTGPLNPDEEKRAPRRVWISGDQELMRFAKVSIVGSRNPTPRGIELARSITEHLVEHDVVIVSGLAKGIDTVAHSIAIDRAGHTIAVLGTPIDAYYPKQNRQLQDRIAQDHLVISQFEPGTSIHRSNFPERNKTMALVSDATIIIEANEDSGTRHQGWEAIRIGRPLFILEHLVVEHNVSWAKKMLEYGAQLITASDLEPVLDVLPIPQSHDVAL